MANDVGTELLRGEQSEILFERAGVGMVVLHGDAIVERANAAFCAIVNRRAEELIGTSCFDFTHPDDLAVNRAATARLATEDPVRFETRYVGDRGVHWVQVTLSQLPERRVLAVVEDISGRKRSEQQVRETAELLTALVENTPECIKLVGPDSTLLQMNPSGLALIEAGKTEEVVGRSVLELIAPEDRTKWRARHERVCSGEAQSWEFDVVGLRGGRRRMATTAVPLAMPDGTTVHLALTRDISAQRRAEAQLRESERRLRDLLGALPVAVYTTDTEGRITYYNDAAVRFWGREPTPDDRWCASWRLYWSDGTPMDIEKSPIVRAVRERRTVTGAEGIAERPDGSRLVFMPHPTPLFDAEDRLIGAVNVLVDVTERKAEEQRAVLLAQEVDHRARNLLAVVSAVVRFTRAATPAEFAAAVEGRVQALSNAHTLLADSRWAGTDVKLLVEQELAPYRGPVTRARTEGPTVRLTPGMAQHLAMALHELATNAVKHGAWSVPDGRVEVTWSVAGGGEKEGGLTLRWEEIGGPPAHEPAHHGFGLMMIEKALRSQSRGSVRLDWRSTGLLCEIWMPAKHLVTG